jgi:uncharacterized Tic20 family protein
MIYQCPRCGVSQTYADERAGQTETCPACGNVNRLPGQPVVPPPGTTAPPGPVPLPPLGAATPPAKMAPDQVKTWGMLCHLAALGGFLVPFGNIIGPLVVWLIQKDKDPFIDQQGKESLNFQITVGIAGVVSWVLVFVFIGILLLVALGIASLVFIILAAISANKGVPYRYPWTIRFIK